MHSLILKVATRLSGRTHSCLCGISAVSRSQCSRRRFCGCLGGGDRFCLGRHIRRPRRCSKRDSHRSRTHRHVRSWACDPLRPCGMACRSAFFDGFLVDHHDRPFEGAGHRHTVIFRYRGFSNGLGYPINPYFGIGRKLTWKPYSPF